MLIDIHHHYVPTSFLDRVRRDGDRYQAVVFRDEGSGLDAFAAGRTEPPNWRGPGRFPGVLEPGIFDLSVRLEEMDAIACAPPPAASAEPLPSAHVRPFPIRPEETRDR